MSSACHLTILGIGGWHHNKAHIFRRNSKEQYSPAEICCDVRLQCLQCRSQQEHRYLFGNQESYLWELLWLQVSHVHLLQLLKVLSLEKGRFDKQEDLMDRNHCSWDCGFEIQIHFRIRIMPHKGYQSFRRKLLIFPSIP